VCFRVMVEGELFASYTWPLFFISTWVLSYLDCYVLPLEFCGAVCVSSPSERKLEIGTNTSIKTPSSPREGPGLIRELVEDWIFPASKLWVTYSSSGAIPHNSTTTAVCQTPNVTAAAFDLLVSLCTGALGTCPSWLPC
jgi:hypothetical protein